ncbi:TMV resistance protein N-like [Dorcoceras hygrometricum]|uniref:TMV resistance protein N-like n=1 Tax=Dorcoceras hygrometricum TaxID=472368 RepID=A0A2Z7A2J6_9LAMI|nr:TMV resistance protein N-like [Dorcoceras hygrometricum]
MAGKYSKLLFRSWKSVWMYWVFTDYSSFVLTPLRTSRCQRLVNAAVLSNERHLLAVARGCEKLRREICFSGQRRRFDLVSRIFYTLSFYLVVRVLARALIILVRENAEDSDL